MTINGLMVTKEQNHRKFWVWMLIVAFLSFITALSADWPFFKSLAFGVIFPLGVTVAAIFVVGFLQAAFVDDGETPPSVFNQMIPGFVLLGLIYVWLGNGPLDDTAKKRDTLLDRAAEQIEQDGERISVPLLKSTMRMIE